MRKKRVYIALLIYLSVYIFADVTLVSEIALKTKSLYGTKNLIENLEYGICNAEYIEKLKFSFLILEKTDEKSLSQSIGNNVVDKTSIVACFDECGKHLYNVGIINSYENGGIVSPQFLYVNSDTLYINDSATKRVSAFHIFPDSALFVYSIDISDFFTGGDFIIESRIICGSTPAKTDEAKNRIVALGTISEDPSYSESKEIINSNYLVSTESFREKATVSFEAFYLKHKIKCPESLNADIMEMVFSGGLFTLCHFSKTQDYIIFASSYGTEYDLYDIRAGSISRNQINSFLNYRNLADIIGFSIKDYRDASSKLRRIMVDSKRDNLFFYYFFNSLTAEVTGFNKSMIVCSLLDNRLLSALIPIDFVPIRYDEKKNVIKGIKVIDGQVFICDYLFRREK